MILAEGRFPNGERALVERLGLGVLALVRVDEGEAVERGGDVGVRRAKALYSLVDDDYANLEIGLNARTFEPDLRLILRMFDEAMSRRIKEHLDIHLTLSMTAIADEKFVDLLEGSIVP